ncbi:MAG: hypothetical protein JWN86_3923, partial [Planctomycetota bacterium]|nr:hypothetical protein [Planctomycetota bacterium]
MVESVVSTRKAPWRTGLGTILAIAILAPAARAQAPASWTFKPLDSYTAKTLLQRAGDQAKQGQWPEALDLYQKVITQYGDAMAPVPKGDPMADAAERARLFVDARQHAQGRIAAMPPEGRAIYRSRMDAQAERWYRQGLADRDRTALRKVVDQAFCSSWGDDALDLLGDIAFQEGQFAEALATYRRIVPDLPGSGAAGLLHPDPDVDLARVAAKKLLCRAALGVEPPTAADFTAFSASYPGSKGAIAGRDGSLAQIVADAIRSDHLALPPQSDGRWPTFAGSQARSKIAPGPIDIGQFQWRVPLNAPPPIRPVAPQRGFVGMGPMVAPATTDIQLPFHPIVLGDQVLVCDEGRILAYHLNARPGGAGGADAAAAGTSEEPFFWDQKLRSANAAPIARQPGAGSPRFTLTAVGDRIYARLGPTGKSGGTSTIIAVRHVGEIQGKRLWDKSAAAIPLPAARPDAPSRYSAVFEGSPVADERGVYVAMTEADAAEIRAYVACLDAETGNPRWIKPLGTAPSSDNAMGMGGMGAVNGSSSSDIGSRLLSLDGQTLYYQTNLGAVAALDCETGAIKWLATYPTRDRNGVNLPRESNPAIVHDGLVVVAPDDAIPIFAFDAATGRLAWKTAPSAHTEKVIHLLGVAKGRLIATGDRVYSFSLKDGAMLKAWPDGPSGFEGYGRGLLAGDSIYWPTKTDIYVLDQSSGAPGDREPIRLMQHHGIGGGNLAVGDGYLVVAQRDALIVFAQNSRLIDRFRQEIAKDPDRAATYFQLARVAEATGQDELALSSLDETNRRAKPSDTIDGQPLADEARSKQYQLLIRLATRAMAAGDWTVAARRFEAAAKAARTDRDRLSARLRLASAQTKAGDPKAAVVTFQEILGNEKLRAQTVANDDRWTVRADLFIGDELAKVLREGGPDLYAEFDREAEKLLERGRREKSARDLEEVGHAYPSAKVAAEALWTLGTLREAENKPAEAVRAYNRLSMIATTDTLRAKSLLGLARAYQAQGLILPARDTRVRAQAK